MDLRVWARFLNEGKTLLESSTQEVYLAGPAAVIPASSSGLSWAPFPRPGHQLGAAQLLAFPAGAFDLLPPWSHSQSHQGHWGLAGKTQDPCTGPGVLLHV